MLQNNFFTIDESKTKLATEIIETSTKDSAQVNQIAFINLQNLDIFN